MTKDQWPDEFYHMNVTDVSHIEVIFKQLNKCVFAPGTINTQENWIEGIADLVKERIYRENLDGELLLATAYDIYFEIQKEEFSRGLSDLVDKGLMTMGFDEDDFCFEMTSLGKAVAKLIEENDNKE